MPSVCVTRSDPALNSLVNAFDSLTSFAPEILLNRTEVEIEYPEYQVFGKPALLDECLIYEHRCGSPTAELPATAQYAASVAQKFADPVDSKCKAVFEETILYVLRQYWRVFTVKREILATNTRT